MSKIVKNCIIYNQQNSEGLRHPAIKTEEEASNSEDATDQNEYSDYQ